MSALLQRRFEVLPPGLRAMTGESDDEELEAKAAACAIVFLVAKYHRNLRARSREEHGQRSWVGG